MEVDCGREGKVFLLTAEEITVSSEGDTPIYPTG